MNRQQGQSLLEVLVVMVVVATILTAIAAGLTFSAKNSTDNKNTALAISLAQETIEVFHRERYALGWTSFQGTLSSATYCLDDLPADSTEFSALTIGSCGASEMITGTNYYRQVDVVVGADTVEVTSIVTWQDGDDTKQVTVDQDFQDID